MRTRKMLGGVASYWARCGMQAGHRGKAWLHGQYHTWLRAEAATAATQGLEGREGRGNDSVEKAGVTGRQLLSRGCCCEWRWAVTLACQACSCTPQIT